jgi:PPOX class probable F420-dependent enzyme
MRVPIRTTGWATDDVALETFLEEPNLARLGTLDIDGAIHVVPVWFDWDGERFIVGAQAGDHKVANIRRLRRASLVIDSDIRRKRGILVRGLAHLVEGEAGREAYARASEAQVRRYQPDRPPHETARRMAGRGEPLVIVITPRSITSWGR